MQVTLSLNDRFALLSVLPQHGHPLAVMKIVAELQDLLGIGNEEATAIGLEALPDGRATYRPGQPDREFAIEGFALELLKQHIRRVELVNELTPILARLWDRLEVGDPLPREEPEHPDGAEERPRNRVKGATR